MPTTRADIDSFLAHRRIALVGVSRNPQDFSRALFREFRAREYDIVPVNPSATEVEGQTCFPSVTAIKPKVEAALLVTPAAETEKVVRDCFDAGIRSVWMHSGSGRGSVNPEAVALCRENGIRLVEGQCPFMFLPGTQLFHRAHGFILKMIGRYPAAA